MQSVYEYWAGKRNGRAMPSRADLDPVEIPVRLWPIIMLLDVVREGDRIRFRYRRVGGEFSREFGREIGREFLDEVLPVQSGFRDYIVDLHCELVRSCRPIYTENMFTFAGQSLPKIQKRISLPLSSDGITVDMALASHVFELEGGSGPPDAPIEVFREITRVVL